MNNQIEYLGENSLEKISEIISKENAKRIFIVCGKKSFSSSKAKEVLKGLIPSAEYFSEFSPDPKIEEINKGFEKAESFSPDLIIGVGGGSSIDVAKAIKLFYFNKTKNDVSLVAVPTTAGSGSESTWFIVYYEGKNKVSAGDSKLTLPKYFILDPTLTYSLPKDVTATSSMDAFSQAVESYWSIYSTEESKQLAKKALEILTSSIVKNVNSPDIETRSDVMIAANLAGKAINITKTTACHSVAYPITSYFGIPHGHAVGLTLGEMLLFNSKVTSEDCNDPRGPDYVRNVIKEISSIICAENELAASKKIKSIMEEIGLKTSLSDLNIDEDGIQIIIDNGFKPERVTNNPRILTKERLKSILSNL